MLTLPQPPRQHLADPSPPARLDAATDRIAVDTRATGILWGSCHPVWSAFETKTYRCSFYSLFRFDSSQRGVLALATNTRKFRRAIDIQRDSAISIDVGTTEEGRITGLVPLGVWIGALCDPQIGAEH